MSRWRLKRSVICLFVSELYPMQSSILVPGREENCYTPEFFTPPAVGPRPVYPRANAAKGLDRAYTPNSVGIRLHL